MKKQTAVEWLTNKLSITFQTMYSEEIEQAKEMEREQMEKCYDHATLAFLETGHFEDYFNKIYGDKQ